MANGLELNYHVTLVKYYILIKISNKDSSFISFKYAIKICKSMDLVTLHNSTPSFNEAVYTWRMGNQ